QLDDDIDLGIARHGENVVGGGNAADVALRVGRTHGNLRNGNSAPGTAGNLLGVTLQNVEGTATDSTQPTDAHFDRLHTQFPISTARNGRSMLRPQKRAAHYEAAVC